MINLKDCKLTTTYEPITSPNRLVPNKFRAVNGKVLIFNKAVPNA